jgi:hypothetical protein
LRAGLFQIRIGGQRGRRGVGSKQFFFEKRTKKLFPTHLKRSRRATILTLAIRQKFFASFFKKEALAFYLS